MKVECANCNIILEYPDNQECPECQSILLSEIADMPEVPGNGARPRSKKRRPAGLPWYVKLSGISAVLLLMAGGGLWTWEQGWWQTKAVPATQFNALYHQSGSALTGKVKWVYKTGGRIASRPAFARQSIFFASEDQHIYAVTTKGETKWKYHTQGVLSSSPFVYQDTVYIGSADHGIYALNATTGELRWRFETNDVVYSSPIVVEDLVYVGSNDGYLYAINTDSGKLVWKQMLGGTIFSAPIYDPNKAALFVTSTNGVLYQLDHRKGRVLWKFVTDENEPIYATPALVGDLVVFNCMDRYVYGVNPVTRKMPLKLNQGTSVSSPFYDDRYIYYGTYSGDVYARDPKQNGKAVWVKPLGEEIVSSPAVVDASVYVASLKGNLYSLDAPSGAQKWKLALVKGEGISSSPIVVDGTLYIGGLDGKLYAVE